MPLKPTEQIISALGRAQSVLLTTCAHPNGDAIASLLAARTYLRRLGKRADAVADFGTGNHKRFSWLPDWKEIEPQIAKSRETIIEFQTGDAPIHGLTYAAKNGTLKIRLFSDHGPLDLKTPKVSQAQYPYDTIVVLDSPDLESLGSIYEKHTEFFYHTPVINIDHTPGNEHFGELNLVELTAVATTEVLFNIISSWRKELLAEPIPTYLLTGLIAESKSFQTPNLTPRSLAIASELVSMGARREHIIEYLFHNKPIETLQLWGRALARLATDPEAGLAWAALNAEDFKETGATQDAVAGMAEEMLAHTPEARAVFLVYPTAEGYAALVSSQRPSDNIRNMLAPLGPRGNRQLVELSLPVKSQKEAVDVIRRTLTLRWPEEPRLPKF